MKNTDKEVFILLDSDVVIHLLKAGRFSLMQELFPDRLRMLDHVKNELEKGQTTSLHLPAIIALNKIEIIDFPTKLIPHFKNLPKSIKGKGEKACIVYCEHNHHIIASSNHRDLEPYCSDNNLTYITTMDAFCIAVNKGIMTENEANKLIKKILSRNSHLCCNSVGLHLSRHFNPEKLLY
jgi:predicted nucleic acid-binding protein